MNIAGSIALDLLSISYMLILVINLGQKSKKGTLDHQYFFIMIMVCAFLILDLLYLSLYGRPGLPFQIGLKIIKSLYFIANCILVWLWARYIDYTIFGVETVTTKYHWVYSSVLVVNLALIVLNAFTLIMFSISPQGTFILGLTGMWTFTLLNYAVVILVTFMILKHRKRIKKSIFIPVLFFPLPPFLAEVIQLFSRQFSLVCTYSLSALIIFQLSQNHVIYTDELTGLANRRMLNESLNRWFSESKGTLICGIMIDLDGLKQINDTYGHLMGDNAIMQMASIIKSINRKDILCARYGGDEFILVWLADNEGDMYQVKQSLKDQKNRLNQLCPEQQRIDFSMGEFCCRDNDNLSSNDFLKQIDDFMYLAKKIKKNH